MANIRDLAREHDDAVSVMAESAKDMETVGLSEARMKELQETFDKASKRQEEINQILVRKRSLEKIEKEQIEGLVEDREQESRSGRNANKPTDKELREHAELFAYAMQYGQRAQLDERERRMLGGLVTSPVETRGTSTQVAGTSNLGGYLVPVLLQNEIIKTMKDYSGILQIGRIRYTSTGAQMTFPSRDLTSRAAVLISEGASLTVQDITYAQKVMDAYTYGDALKISYQLLQDSEIDMNSEFTDAFGESFGRAANTSLTTGTGSSQPNGIVTAAAAGVTAASATAFTLGEVIDLSHSVDPAYRNSNACGYMMHDTILASIKKLSLAATNMGAGTWQPSFRDGTPATINGYPYWINQGMSSALTTGQKIILFGDYNKYNIRIARDMVIMRNDYSGMSTLTVDFYGYARWDGELFDTTAVKRLTLA